MQKLLLTFFAASLIGCSTSKPNVPLQRFEFTRPEMGVPFRIVLYARDEAAATMASEAAFGRVQQLNDILSDYEEDSELTRLSQTAGSGKAVKVSDDLWRVLNRAQEVAAKSEGAFDVTIGPCVSLWRRARREKKFPDSARLRTALAATGFKKLKLDAKNKSAKLLVPNMRLDLGGIAKGFAVDEAQKVLKEYKIKSALVSGGGDMMFSEPPPGKRGWKIELSDLETNAPKQFILLSNAALATSGDTFQFVDLDGKRYSHIVDPRTGVGLTDHSLVNIIAPNCTAADALSTAVSVLGPEEGLEFAAKEKAAARILRRPDVKIERLESKRFKKFYE